MSKNCTNDGCSCTPNMSIKCSVTSCAHHCQDKCTDCQSFRKI